MNKLLAGLNPRQREAVQHGEGPLLILAGAGSGKTRTLMHRIAYLIGEHGVAPWQILAVTFTNKAAAEMRERLQQLLGETEGLWVSTFHAACVRILRREAEVLGFTSDFTIYDDQDQERLLRVLLKELDIGERVLKPRTAAAAIDSAKNRGLLPQDLPPEEFSRAPCRWSTSVTRNGCGWPMPSISAIFCCRRFACSGIFPMCASAGNGGLPISSSMNSRTPTWCSIN